MMTAFLDRSAQYCRQAAQAAKTWYDAEGNWIAATCPPDPRERLWLCLGLYSVGEGAFADTVIRAFKSTLVNTGPEGDTRFDIFITNVAIELLVAHGDKMAADVRAKLEGIARDAFLFLPGGNRRADFQFHGYNDNMPAKATMGLILGGELLGDEGAVEHGLWNLKQLRAQLIRSGINSEWNSPTYTPLTIHAMAEISERARHPEAREIAGKIEERLWLDVAARFHPEMGMVAGPYSRAYTVDTLCQFTSLSSLLWLVLGDVVKPSPLGLFHIEPGYVLHHEGDAAFNIAQMTWFAAGHYHVPERAMALFAKKSYPFHAIATAEHGNAGPDFPACPNRIQTYLERDFALGTSRLTFLDGHQAAPYFVTYKKKQQVESLRDVGSVFHRFLVNDEIPGTVNPGEYANSGEQDSIPSRCHVLTVQSEATAMVLANPYPQLGGLETNIPPKPLSRLNEMIVFPSHFGGADEIQVGVSPRESWSGEVARGEWIGCRRGRLLIALRPMVYSRDFGPVRITLEKVNHYEVIRSTFYEGEERIFSRQELRDVFGGFVAEHASVDDYPSLSAFLAELSSARFTDFSWTTRRTRYRRPASKTRPALELETSWAPGSSAPRFIAINGQPATSPRVEIDGLSESDFPFLTEKWESVPGYFPWEKLAYGTATGVIGDRESDLE